MKDLVNNRLKLTFLNYLFKFSSYLLYLSVVSIFLGCARSANPDIERGSDYKYQRGFPEVRFTSTGFLNEKNKPYIHITADIVNESLIYKYVDNAQKARVAIDVRIIKKETNDDIVESKHFEIDILKKDLNLVGSGESYLFEKRLNVPPGSYRIYLTIIDLNSKKEVTRIAETFIPNPNSDQINLTNIRMLGKNVDNNTSWIPISTYDVPGKIDSLMFIFQATNNDPEKPLTITSNLIGYNADLSVARPMFFRNYSKGTTEYKGLKYSSDRVIRQSKRKLLQQGSVFIEFKFANQKRGNYRFEVKTNNTDMPLNKARDFSIKSTNYPAVKTPRELARPLIYLMDDGEYDNLMALNNQDSIKATIDRFWLKHIGDKNQAAQVIEKYYQRVVEANKQFSNFKEGWKTDPGMVYILFGPPFYVNERADKMTWSYSNNVVNDPYIFRFIEPNVQSEFFPFQHFILQRSQEKYQVQYQQKQLWLTELILTRNI